MVGVTQAHDLSRRDRASPLAGTGWRVFGPTAAPLRGERHHGAVDLGLGIGEAVPARVRAIPAVTGIELRGSRARGDAGPFSDWDFVVWTSDFPTTEQAMPRVAEELHALVGLWDGLSDVPCYMLILEGPVKVDLIFAGIENERDPPWQVSAATLSAIDGHFWDWTLWLTSKVDAGKRGFVAAELTKMHQHLLGPLGVGPVDTLQSAVSEYLRARTNWEQKLGVRVDDRLGSAVSAVVAQLGTD
jgi:hypothetical protein